MRYKAEDLGRAALSVALATSALGLTQPAFAADGGWQAGDLVVRAGPAGILFDGSAEISIAGAPVPDGGVTLSDNWTVSSEIEYFLTPAMSAAFNFGIPPTTRIDTTGSLAPFGTAGKVKYGLGALTARYHLELGAVSPFVGAGIGHLRVFSESDGAVQNLDADSAWAPVFQAGANVHLNPQVGLYGSVTYAPLKTDARGEVLGAPMTARVTLNPTVVQGGLFYRF